MIYNLSDKSFFKNRIIYFYEKNIKQYQNFERNSLIKNIHITEILNQDNELEYFYKNIDLKTKISDFDLLQNLPYKPKKMGYYKKLRADRKLAKRLKEVGLKFIFPKQTFLDKMIIRKFYANKFYRKNYLFKNK